MTVLDVTVVGAGTVGSNLARRAVELGHRVRFGARDVGSEKVRAALADIPSTTAVDLSSAAHDADLVVLAVPFDAVVETVSALGDPGDAVIVDATNPVGAALPDGTTSIPDLIARARPGATVVKAFNTIGAEWLLDPVAGDHRCFLPVAGPEPAASTVRDLASAMGFDALVVGGIADAELLEQHARWWIHLAFRTGLGRGVGFARIDRPAGGAGS